MIEDFETLNSKLSDYISLHFKNACTSVPLFMTEKMIPGGIRVVLQLLFFFRLRGLIGGHFGAIAAMARLFLVSRRGGTCSFCSEIALFLYTWTTLHLYATRTNRFLTLLVHSNVDMVAFPESSIMWPFIFCFAPGGTMRHC